MRRPAVALALAAVLLAAACGSGSDAVYRQAVTRAGRLVAAAESGNRGAAAQAAQVLKDGTGCSQIEILAELDRGDPASLNLARGRLDALALALASPLSAAPGGSTEAGLRARLLRPPYAAQQLPSAGDLLTGWWQDLQSGLPCVTSATSILGLIVSVLEYAGAGAILLLVVLAIWRALRRLTRRGRAEAGAGEGRPSRGRTAQELFDEADRLSTAGDLAGAVRALARAVATVLGGESAWESSPLTVREIYAGAGELESLRPLLREFEVSVYGHRELNRDDYAAAAAVAEPYRALKDRPAA